MPQKLKLSPKVDECKPLAHGQTADVIKCLVNAFPAACAQASHNGCYPLHWGRGLNSFTSRLNLSRVGHTSLRPPV